MTHTGIALDLDAPIGVIADTHGTLRDKALALLEGCRLIVHLGDVGSRAQDVAMRAMNGGTADCCSTPAAPAGAASRYR